MSYRENWGEGIHPTAIIHENARIGANVIIGPYSVIGPNVEIGDNCVIFSHVVIDGYTKIGCANRIYNGASIGMEPQDLKYNGEKTYVYIGSNNTIREYVTINRGTSGGGSETRVGDHNLIMAYTHIAHDCKIGSHIILANEVTMAGHVVIEDHAVLSGATGLVQFVKIGTMAMTGGITKISKDLPPYCVADGVPAKIRGVNSVGLRRNGFSEDVIKVIKKAFRVLYRSKLTTKQAIQKIEEEFGQYREIQDLLIFITNSDRGITR